MKALFFLNAFVGGGAEKVCLNLARQLYIMGIESDFITIYNVRADYDIPDYIHEFSLGIDIQSSFIKTFQRIIQGVNGVNEFISGKDYVLITAHLQSAELLASFTKVGKKCLYVMHVSQHLSEKYNDSRLCRMGIKLFFKGKKIITVSKGLKKELENECKVASKDVDVIYNPGAVNILRSAPKLDAPHEKPYILFVGRLEQHKDPLMALELYFRGGFYKDYDLIYLGKGSLENSLKKRISDYGLKDKVYLNGFQKDTVQWTKHAVLLLSTSKQEGLPMNLIEALTCGTPVVAADCPYGPNEILTGELKKYLIHPDQYFNESVSVISSALNFYPEITEKYYKNFKDELIVQRYLDVWEYFFD